MRIISINPIPKEKPTREYTILSTIVTISNYAIFTLLAYYMPDIFPNLFDRHEAAHYRVNRDTLYFWAPIAFIFLFTWGSHKVAKSIVVLILRLLSGCFALAVFIGSAYFVKAFF